MVAQDGKEYPNLELFNMRIGTKWKLLAIKKYRKYSWVE